MPDSGLRRVACGERRAVRWEYWEGRYASCIGQASRRHAAAVTDELLPGALERPAPVGLDTLHPGSWTARRLTLTLCWDRRAAQRRRVMLVIRLGHVTPLQADGLRRMTCPRSLHPASDPAPVAAPGKPHDPALMIARIPEPQPLTTGDPQITWRFEADHAHRTAQRRGALRTACPAYSEPSAVS
jgi:hypothetical protein